MRNQRQTRITTQAEAGQTITEEAEAQAEEANEEASGATTEDSTTIIEITDIETTARRFYLSS